MKGAIEVTIFIILGFVLGILFVFLLFSSAEVQGCMSDQGVWTLIL